MQNKKRLLKAILILLLPSFSSISMDGYEEYDQDGTQQQTSQCDDGTQVAPKTECNDKLPLDPIDPSQDDMCQDFTQKDCYSQEGQDLGDIYQDDMCEDFTQKDCYSQDSKDLGDVCQDNMSQGDICDQDQSQCIEQKTKTHKKRRHKKAKCKEREYLQIFGVNICGNKDKNDTGAYYDIDTAAVLEYQQYNNSSFRFTDVLRGKVIENVIFDGLDARVSSSGKVKNGEFHAVNLKGAVLSNVTIRNMDLIKDIFMDKETLLEGVTFETSDSVCDLGFKKVKMKDVLFQDNDKTCNIRLLGAKIWNGVEFEKVTLFNLEEMKIRVGLK